MPVVERVRYGTEDNLLAASAAGDRLAYLPWSGRRRLVWVDRKGRELGTLGEVGGYEDVRLSPDGNRVAVALRDPAHGLNQDVWVLDVARGTPTRITSERTDEFAPAWFPDGERLAYVSDHLGFYDLFERPASGGAEKTLVATKQDKIFPSVSPDGRSLLYSASEGPNFVRVLSPLSGGGKSRPPERAVAILRGASRDLSGRPVLRVRLERVRDGRRSTCSRSGRAPSARCRSEAESSPSGAATARSSSTRRRTRR